METSTLHCHLDSQRVLVDNARVEEVESQEIVYTLASLTQEWKKEEESWVGLDRGLIHRLHSLRK